MKTPEQTLKKAYTYYIGNNSIKHYPTRDYAKAFKLFLEAAEAGHWEACRMVGKMYADGHGVERNYDEAGKWYTRAKETCTTDSRVWTIDSDIKELEEKIAAENGDAIAMKKLAEDYRKSADTYEEAIRFLKILAESGDAESQFYLGDMYVMGAGVGKDIQEAIKWYSLALEQKCIGAALRIGQVYLKGDGVEKDIEAARKYVNACDVGEAEELESFIQLVEAADSESTFALNKLATRYRYGLDVVKDGAEAARLYKKAAENGDAEAMYDLGDMYYNGGNVEQNIHEAINWYKLAAEQPHYAAARKLVEIYINGNEVDRDFEQAAKYAQEVGYQAYAEDVLHTIEFMKGAENGDPAAQRALGLDYANKFYLEYSDEKIARLLKLGAKPMEPTPEIEAITRYIMEHNTIVDDEPYKGRCRLYENGMEFDFYPPSYNVCERCCGQLILVENGIILLEDIDNCNKYLLEDCLDPTIENLLEAIGAIGQ